MPSSALSNLGKILLPAMLALLALLTPGVAHAAPGDGSQIAGTAQAQVIGPFEIEPIADLRFGGIARPAAPGTVSIGSDGVITSTVTLSSVTGPRGPAVFAVRGEPNRRFITQLPGPITISNGTATMIVDQFRSNTFPPGVARLDSRGIYILTIGGRLKVNANQLPGSYTGTFEVTVLYQ